MSERAYQWKPNSQISIDPQLAGETVEMLRQRLGGQVTAKDLLDHARASNSPLHEAFEWNDSEAAEKYREQQAAYILRHLVVTVKVAEKTDPVPLRAFVNVVKDEKRGYTSLARAMSDKELRDQIVKRAWQELLQWRERYREYSELAEICAAIDRESEGEDKKGAKGTGP